MSGLLLGFLFRRPLRRLVRWLAYLLLLRWALVHPDLAAHYVGQAEHAITTWLAHAGQ